MTLLLFKEQFTELIVYLINKRIQVKRKVLLREFSKEQLRVKFCI